MTAAIRLLLGRSRARRQRGAEALGFHATDPVGRPVALFVDGGHATRVALDRAWRDRGAFSVEVRTLDAALGELWARHGDGRAIVSARAEALIAERLLDHDAGRWPRLALLARPAVVGRALADLARALEERGLVELPEATPHREELGDAIRALRAAWEALDGGIVRVRAVEAVIGQLERPGPQLRAALQRHPLVWVEPPVDPGPQGIRAITALVRAWAREGVEVAIGLDSGPDGGGREAGALLGWDPDPDGEPRGLRATRALRAALAGAFVGTGEAEVVVVGRDGPRVVEPWSEAVPAAPPDLADLLRPDRPLPVGDAEGARAWLAGRVALSAAGDPDAELVGIARSVRRALDRGIAPGDCAVGWAGLGRELARVREALAAHGVPVAGPGGPVGEAPVARALAELAALPTAGWPADRTLALADFAGWSLDVPPGELARWCAAAGVTGPVAAWGGPLRGLLRRTRRSASLPALDAALDRLQAVVDRLAPLTRPQAPGAWRDHLVDAALELGLIGDDRVAVAWGASLAALDALVIDLTAVDAGPWGPDRLAEHLAAALDAAPLPGERDPLDRVALVSPGELLATGARHVWLGGLVRGAFPGPTGGLPLVPPELARKLDRGDPPAEARHLLHALLREALDDPEPRALSLSWHLAAGGRPAGPALALADLLDQPTTAGRSFGELVTDPIGRPVAPWSTAELARLAVADAAWVPWLPAEATAALTDRRSREAARAAGSQAWRGALERPPPPPEALSVTALEQLVRCPARWWYDRVLALATEDPWSPELEPRRRGTAVHRVLQRFVQERGGESLAGADRDRAAADLHRVALEELDRVEAEGGFDPALQAWARGRWLAGLVDDKPRGVLASWLEAEIARTDGLIPVAVERSFDGLEVGGLRLRGAMDRLDRHPDGAWLVTDYKTGQPPPGSHVAEGIALQPLVYARAAQEAAPGAPIAAAFLTLARADDVRRKAWTGDPVALEQLAPDEARPVALTAAERDALLDRAAARALTALAGAFPTTDLDPGRAGCPTCPHARICRVAHADPAGEPDRSP